MNLAELVGHTSAGLNRLIGADEGVPGHHPAAPLVAHDLAAFVAAFGQETGFSVPSVVWSCPSRWRRSLMKH